MLINSIFIRQQLYHILEMCIMMKVTEFKGTAPLAQLETTPLLVAGLFFCFYYTE